MNGIDFLKNFVGILIVILFVILPILGWLDKHFHTLLIFILLIILIAVLIGMIYITIKDWWDKRNE
jgi:glucan phosphoethanolaminetransferase (alkaline phosphatase superfamily)